MGKQAVSKLMYSTLVIITFLLFISTVLGAFTSYFNPNRFPLLGYLSLILPGLLILNSLFILFWGLQKKRWVYLPLLAIIANTGYLITIFQYSTHKKPQGKTIKIATYNIHAFNNESTGYSAKQIARFMEREQVDILCFQEFSGNQHFPQDSLFQTFSVYPYKYVPLLPNKGTRIAIFSKYPLTDTCFIPFPQSYNCGMWADISVEQKNIRIFNVHMQTTYLNQNKARFVRENVYYNNEAKIHALATINKSLLENLKIRAAQADIIYSNIQATHLPIILCGDFNDTPASYVYRRNKGKLKDGFQTCGKGYQYTFRKLGKLLRIDYIFHSPALKGIQYYSPPVNWSDHNPVIMEIEV